MAYRKDGQRRTPAAVRDHLAMVTEHQHRLIDVAEDLRDNDAMPVDTRAYLMGSIGAARNAAAGLLEALKNLDDDAYAGVRARLEGSRSAAAAALTEPVPWPDILEKGGPHGEDRDEAPR